MTRRRGPVGGPGAGTGVGPGAGAAPGAGTGPGAGAEGGAGGLLVLVDVGNTNAVFGVYRGDLLIKSIRLSTDPERTSDEHAALLLPLFQRAGLDPAAAEAVVISSVVPPLHPTLERLSRELFGRVPLPR